MTVQAALPGIANADVVAGPDAGLPEDDMALRGGSWPGELAYGELFRRHPVRSRDDELELDGTPVGEGRDLALAGHLAVSARDRSVDA